jgi:hypothetical protein
VTPLPCPECGSPSTFVLRTNTLRNGTIRRRHACRSCTHRWTTLDGPLPDRPTYQPRATPYSPRGLTERDIVAILLSPEPDPTLASLYNCSRQSISNIRLGRTFPTVRPDIPRRTSVRSSHAPGPTCTTCSHWSGTSCTFGFPEAVTDPTFARDCDLFLAA